MVHALREAWRVLATDGTLVDLRPLSLYCPVEAVTADKLVQIGELDGTGMSLEDKAADRALGDAVEAGWFVPRRRATFDFEFYWDTLPEMASFVESSKRMKELLPSSVSLERVHRRLDAYAPGRVRLRCRRATLLAVYDKATTRYI